MYDIITIIIIFLGIGIIILSFYKDKKGLVVSEKSINEKYIDHYEEYGARIEELNNKILELNEYGTFLKSELDKKHKELLFLYQIIHEKTNKINSTPLKQEESIDIENEFHDKQIGTNEQAKVIMEQKGNKTERFQTINKQQELNNNKMILQLSERGYNVTDIAQMLNIGQGEVKLVLDLFE